MVSLTTAAPGYCLPASQLCSGLLPADPTSGLLAPDTASGLLLLSGLVFAAAIGGPLAAVAISGSLAGLVSRRLRSRKSRSRLLRGSTRSSADEPAEHKITTTSKQRRPHDYRFSTVLQIHNILLRIPIRILLFSSLTFKTQQKTNLKKMFFCLLFFEGTFTSFFKDKKSKRSHKAIGVKVFLTTFT
jgi:hypothetical protein